jgi:tetratricopeptide (TPR) repeat protein
MTQACPSCAAPLDDEGICTSCGALTRGFFRDLDLGTPQLAAAVAHGLDFYRLLEVAPDADIRAVARRYRQLRVLFPDDPSSLATAPARRLALLEVAGRVLTDPQLRRAYDDMRADHASEVVAGVVRCQGCSAPLPPDVARCPFCSTPCPVAHPVPLEPPGAGPPATEPVDYYALLGVSSQHLLAPLSRPTGLRPPLNHGLLDLLLIDETELPWDASLSQQANPPAPEDVDAAALVCERRVLLATGLTPDERAARLEEYEIARRVLRDTQLRGKYDMLLIGFRRGQLDGGRLDALRQLQDSVRAAITEERGEQPTPAEGAALLKQGQGYLDARLPREAINPLRRAIQAQPQSIAAHTAYVQAILAADDPLDLGGHMLREIVREIELLEAHGAALANGPALAALCRGLLARDTGETAIAEAEVSQATRLDGRLAPAWRAMAALALGRNATEEALSCCRRALAVNPRDERALLMATAACLRSNQRNQAREAAAQIVALRGEGWTVEDVLRELTG